MLGQSGHGVFKSPPHTKKGKALNRTTGVLTIVHKVQHLSLPDPRSLLTTGLYLLFQQNRRTPIYQTKLIVTIEARNIELHFSRHLPIPPRQLRSTSREIGLMYDDVHSTVMNN